MLRAVIKGVGSALPKRQMTNADISKIVDTTDEWIVERTGIKARYIADDTETTRTLAVAAVTVAQGGVSRVGLVYTPAEKRKRGYASMCVALLTARELTTPGRICMLYTDLANPTSNSIYQAVGYRRMGDAVELRFSQRPDGDGRPG